MDAKVAVLGAGNWGTVLADRVARNGREVKLWTREPAVRDEVNLRHTNAAWVPGLELSPRVRAVTDPGEALDGVELVFVVIPAQAMRDVCKTVGEHLEPNHLVVHAAKAALSCDSLMVFYGEDLVGVELSGALKNVIAIAAGVCDGLGFGDNSKAALITRGQAEVRRLGVACGARSETFSGLSGLGDLTVTCFSRLSRNRSLGEQLGRGRTLEQITSATTSIAEGVPTARSALRLATRLGVEVPIIREVHAMLFEGKPVPQGVRDLLSRDHKAED